MGKLMIVIGTILMVASMGILFMGIAGTDNPTTAQILQSLHCKSGEKIVQHLGAYRYDPQNGGGRELSFTCEIEPGQGRDVTGSVIISLIIGFSVPFVGGLLLFIFGTTRAVWGFTRNVARQATQFTVTGGTTYPNPRVQNAVIDLRGGQSLDSVDIPPQAKQVLEGLFGNIAQMGTTMTSISNSSTLADKLAQLEEARTKGLINDIEYEKTRKAILDSFDD